MSENTTLTFNKGVPKLTPDIIGGDVAVLTFQSLAREQKTRVGPADVITFKEYPDHGWYVNVSSLKRIAQVYGADYSKWIGEPIVLIRRSGFVVGTSTPSNTLWAANPAEDAEPRESWTKLLAAAKRRAK